MNTIYGDSYGGVQQAEQAANQSDNSMTLGLIAAHQAAQQIAMQQQTQQNAVEAAAQNRAIQMADSAERSRQFDLDYGLRKEATGNSADYQQGLLDDRADARDAMLEQRRQKLFDEAQTAHGDGKSMSMDIWQSMLDANNTKNDLTAAQREYDATMNRGVALAKKEQLRWDGKKWVGVASYKNSAGDVVPAPSSNTVAVDINEKLRLAAEKIRQAQTEAAQKQRDLQNYFKQAFSKGFDFNPASFALVHPKTQQAFPIQPVGSASGAPNSQRIRSYDPSTRTLQ